VAILHLVVVAGVVVAGLTYLIVRLRSRSDRDVARDSSSERRDRSGEE
jgi:hypothetical protein